MSASSGSASPLGATGGWRRTSSSAFWPAKVLERRLRGAGLNHTIAHALDILAGLKAVEHTWEGQALVVKLNRADEEAAAILAALGIHVTNPVLAVSKAPAA